MTNNSRRGNRQPQPTRGLRSQYGEQCPSTRLNGCHFLITAGNRKYGRTCRKAAALVPCRRVTQATFHHRLTVRWGAKGVMRMLHLGDFVLVAFLPAFSSAGCSNAHTRQGAESLNVPAAGAPLLSGKNTLVYHTRECRYCRDIPDKELLGFAHPDTAARGRRIPCAVCRPRENFVLQTPVSDAPTRK